MDAKTLILAAFVVAFATTLSMLLVLWTRRTYPGFGYWVAGTACGLLAGLLFLLPRDQFSAWLTIVLANYLLLVEVMLFLNGTLLFRGLTPRLRRELIGSLVYLSLLGWFSVGDPNLNARVVISSLFHATWALWLARVLWTRRPAYFGSFDTLQTGVWLIMGSADLGRAVSAGFLAPPQEDFLTGPALQNLWILVLITAALLITVSQIVINAQRLEYELKRTRQELEADIRERQKTEEQLRISEERHRILAENALDVIWTVEPDGTLSYVSSAVERLCGISPAEAQGLTLAQFHPPESRAISLKYARDLRARIASGRPVKPFRGELEYGCKNGSTIWCDVMVYPLLDQDGRLRQLLGVSRDISEQKRHLLELKQARDLAEEANQALQDANTELLRLATTDELTGVWNRRHFEQTATQEIKRKTRYSDQPLSLILFDIDHFKAINDTHGHLIGDQVLVALVQRVREQLRNIDVLARWGGEEFVIMLPHCGLSQAHQLAERLRALIAAEPFAEAGRITSSFGVAEYHSPESPDAWLNRADKALYQAKEAGRNQVCVEDGTGAS